MVSDESAANVPPAREPGDTYPALGTETLLDYSLRTIVPGLIAMVLVAIGALGVGWLPLDTMLGQSAVVEALRSSSAGAIVSKFAVVAGIVLFLQCWLLLGYDIMRNRVPEVKWLWVTLGVWSVPLLVAPPLFSRDVYSYFAQGKLMVEGVNPYLNGSATVPGWFADGVDPLWAEAPTPYGQLWLLLAKGVAAFIGPHPYSGALFLRLISFLGVVMLAVAIPRIATHCGIDARKALWLGVLNPLVFMHFISGAHNDALMIGLIAVAFAVTLNHWPWLGALLIGMAGSIKPIGLVALPFIGLLWAGSPTKMRVVWLRWVYCALLAAGVLVIFGLFTRTGFGWVAALSTPGEVRTWLSPPTAIGMIIGGALGLFGIDAMDAAITTTRLIGTVAAAAIIAWLSLRPFGRNPIRGAAIALLAVVALGPVVQPWYLLWSLPLFAAVGLARIELRIAIVGTAGLTLFGLSTSSATQDSLLQISEGIAGLAVVALMALLLFGSVRERRLLLGSGGVGIEPDTEVEQIAADSLVMRRSTVSQ